MRAAARTAAAALLATLCAAGGRAETRPGDWDMRAATAYLDSRAAWWMDWKGAQRDHGTFCVSCHTALPYALARPALRAALGERERPPAEARLLDNVARRVALWRDVEPFYPDQLRGLPKTSESRGTEAILNALILANRDAGGGRLADETRAALANLWALQMRTPKLSGSWAWLDFGYEPWEAAAAPYFGAALAALAVGTAPEGYASNADVQPGVKLLHEYLGREFEGQQLFNRLAVLWASARVPGLLAEERARSISEAALSRQRDDGGWSTASLGAWKRLDDSARDPQSDAGLFMSDAATAFAVLSLTQARETR